MEYNIVAIMLLRACNASCDFCGVESGPKCHEKLDTELIKKYIYSTKNVPEINCIGLTGGELFLDYELTRELVDYVTKCGKDVTVMTNCFWAKNYDVAYNKLYGLKQLGLKTIGISFDYYHNKFIPEQNIKNTLRAARQLSIITSINTVYTADWTMGELYDRMGEELLDTVSNSFLCFPVGRAKKVIPQDQFIRSIPSKHCYCNGGGAITIKYEGSIYPCCSPYVFETELSFGNYESSTAKDTLNKLKSSRILYLLQLYGFDFFLRIAEEELGIYIPKYVISPCELCALLFSKENIIRFYPYVYEKTEELILERENKCSYSEPQELHS